MAANPQPRKTGVLLSGLSLSCLVFGLELASRGETAAPNVLALTLGLGLLAGLGYVFHARRTSHPILDFSLMKVPTFGLSVAAGSLSRITGGSLPFLLPLMMQVGFGYSAAHSGAITFATATGALVMKFAGPRILRRFGFRRTLVWNGLIASGFLALCAAFRPGWPHLLVYGVLLAGGFFQSLQFTAYNTVAYADIPQSRISLATSFYATFQQLMLSMGICFASGTLALSMSLGHHTHATLPDFSVAFLAVTAVSVLASPLCLRLSPNAGDAMTGYREGEA